MRWPATSTAGRTHKVAMDHCRKYETRGGKLLPIAVGDRRCAIRWRPGAAAFRAQRRRPILCARVLAGAFFALRHPSHPELMPVEFQGRQLPPEQYLHLSNGRAARTRAHRACNRESAVVTCGPFAEILRRPRRKPETAPCPQFQFDSGSEHFPHAEGFAALRLQLFRCRRLLSSARVW